MTTLAAAGPPRSASIKTVESSTTRAISAGATLVSMALSPDPSPWVGVPIVGRARESSECRLDVLPTLLVVEAALDQLSNDLVVQRYVQTHLPNVGHERLSAVIRQCCITVSLLYCES